MVILVADKNNTVRERIAGILSRLNDVSHVTQTRSYKNLLDLTILMTPDFLLMDYFQFSESNDKQLLEYLGTSRKTRALVYIEETEFCDEIKFPAGNNLRLIKMSEIIQHVDSKMKTGSEL